MTSFVRRFRHSKSHTSAQLSPLHITELLEIILFYLGPHALRFGALRVCRQWSRIAKSLLLASPVHWIEHPDAGDQQQCEVLRRLDLTHSFTFQNPALCDHFELSCIPAPPISNDSKTWVDLFRKFMEVSRTRGLRIEELVILRPLLLTTQLIPILAMTGSLLTSLRMENLDCEDVPIDMMLAMCPRLMVLYVHSFSTAYYQDLFRNGKAPEYERPELPSRLPLRSLTLMAMGVEEKTLLQLLSRCTDLDELRLIQLLDSKCYQNTTDRIGPADEELVSFVEGSFLDRVTELCQKLTSIHFSGEAGSLWRGASLDKITSTLRLFPLVRKWSFPSFKISGATFRALQEHHIQNTLTTLEILGLTASANQCPDLLHRYLCDSPHLLHLKAPQLSFSILWFDLEGILDEGGSYHGKKHSLRASLIGDKDVGQFEEPFRRRIWACRNLRTLHLRCEIESGDSNSHESTLVMFGYLSKVCPRLQDLALGRNLLNLSIDGGFCLLMRLHELQKLRIRIDPVQLHGGLYLDWMARTMAMKQRVKTKLVMATYSALSARSIFARTPFASSTGSHPPPHMRYHSVVQCNIDAQDCSEANGNGNGDSVSWSGVGAENGIEDVNAGPDYMIDGVDMRNLGRWKDISDVVHDRLSNNWPCWPALEYIEVELNKDLGDRTGEKIKGLLTTLRPDVEIQLIENWLFHVLRGG